MENENNKKGFHGCLFISIAAALLLGIILYLINAKNDLEQIQQINKEWAESIKNYGIDKLDLTNTEDQIIANQRIVAIEDSAERVRVLEFMWKEKERQMKEKDTTKIK